MTRKEKAGFVAEKLTELYPKTTSPLTIPTPTPCWWPWS